MSQEKQHSGQNRRWLSFSGITDTALFKGWVFFFMVVWLFLVVFADFLANNKPLLCKIDDQVYSPVLVDLSVKTGLRSSDSSIRNQTFSEDEVSWAIWPPIPYDANELNLAEGSYLPPGSGTHWLGTDLLGRDVAAGLIHGARKAFFIGVFSMILAGILGIVLGALAAYYGDKGVRMYWWQGLYAILAICYVLFYGDHLMQIDPHGTSSSLYPILGIIVILVFIGVGLYLLGKKASGRGWPVPLDAGLMRLIELFESLPKLLIILAVAAIIKGGHLWQIAVLIGFLAWPEIARLIRGEILKLKNQGFVDANRVLGLRDARIIWVHLLPNAIGPVLITLAFGVGSAILLEAFLSFLGIGIAENEVTWGSMISQAREYFAAWWLAVFPGIALFLAIFTTTMMAEKWQQRLDKNYRTPHFLQ